jgi:hypothetical protein
LRFVSCFEFRVSNLALPSRFVCLILLLLLCCATASAQPSDDSPGRWQLESLTLRGSAEGDEKIIRGLIQGQTEEEIDFAEIVQPPGKPMYAVIRGIPRSEVAKIEQLDEEAHLTLFKRFALFRSRAVIEAGRMDALDLISHGAGAGRTLEYQGPWFRLTSTADEEQTRRSLVRIEQMFRAYRTLLPPRVEKPRRLEVQLFGSLDRYRERLRELNLQLDNAAFYAPQSATILAASDLDLFAERLAQVRRQYDAVRQDLNRLDSQHGKKLAELAEQLKTAGFQPDEITAELRQRKATWKKELETNLATNLARQRAAERKFDVVTDAMFRSLAHESFHAWLDTHVYPHGQFHVPRWLHEGLAQVFESSQFDGDSLRLDAPDKNRLAELRTDLNSGQPLALAQVLTADQRQFLGPHAGDAPQRHYLYAWGLAFYLTFHENLLDSPRLDAYVSQDAQNLGPIARFEQLTGMPLPEFQTRWRAAMLEAR